jgi:hypothetical protein
MFPVPEAVKVYTGVFATVGILRTNFFALADQMTQLPVKESLELVLVVVTIGYTCIKGVSEFPNMVRVLRAFFQRRKPDA